jgi:hypothetical protein
VGCGGCGLAVDCGGGGFAVGGCAVGGCTVGGMGAEVEVVAGFGAGVCVGTGTPGVAVAAGRVWLLIGVLAVEVGWKMPVLVA